MLGDSTTPTRRRGARTLGWVAVGSIVALLMLGSTTAAVLAVGTSLHQTPPISFDDPDFQGSDEECAGADGNWHFVLVQTAAASGTLTATFQDGGVFVVGSTKKTGGTLHFDVPAGDDTLLGASTDVVGKLLLLSHICGGTTTTTTTTVSTTTSVSTTGSSTTSAP